MKQEPVSMVAPQSVAARSMERIAKKLENREENEKGFGIVQLFSSVIKMKFHRR